MGWFDYGAKLLMIGAAYTQSTGVEITSEYAVLLSPGLIHVISGRGGASSPLVRSTVVSGVGPFTYQWTITGTSISISSPTSEDTNFTSGGYNNVNEEVATLTVTDEGQASAETSVTMNVTFDFNRGDNL